MVVNGEKIFFSSTTLLRRWVGCTLMGGVFFEKSLARSPFRYAPAPSSDTRPCPAEGGVGGRHRIEVQNIYTTICGSPSMSPKHNPISLNKD